MIIPAKYQLSRDNDPDNSTRINNITKRYSSCVKKFGLSKNKSKAKDDKEIQNLNFQSQVLEWFFKLSLIDRIKVSSINNKWVFQTLHQLYTEQKKKNNLKFIPRINEKPQFLKKLAGTNIFADNPSHFLNYFAFSSQNYELMKNYNEKIEKDFLKEITLFYPDLAKISKIKSNEKEILENLIKYYYPVFTLNESVLNNQEKFIKYFKTLTNNNFFNLPPVVISSSKQNDYNDDKESENNNLMDSLKFNNLNPLNNIIKNYNNTNENNSNNNSNYNRIQNYIDLPSWAKQPKDSKLCFSINELFLAFIEQNIVVYYIIFSYDNQFYQSIINDNVNTSIEEFVTLKNELKDFLSINKENLFDLLNLDSITKEIYYDSNIEKFVSIKKYQNNLISKTKCWKENINLEQEFNKIKEYFNDYNNDNLSMIRLINDLSTFNLEQIYSFEDFFFNKIFFNLNKKFENSKNENLISEFMNESPKNKKKKKRNKKKKKKENEEKKENEINININLNNIDNINKEESKEKENKIIEIKKFINIEEDEELSRIKKGYIKLESNENNLCESSGSENNNCDSKPLLSKNSSDVIQIMKEKEYKYNSNNEEINININNEEENINIIHNEQNKIEDIKNNKEQNKNEIIIENNNREENKKEENNNNNINIENKEQEKDNNKNNNDIKSSSNNKKKKSGNFFLYPTIKKNTSDKITKPPFIMKLNEDIIFYNKTLITILDSLLSLKEYIIERIKSQIKECLYSDSFSYKVDIYGSFKSHLDIVCSDIDMVFIPNKINKVDISDLIQRLSNHLLSTKEYYKVNPIYTASIPLIKLIINYESYLTNNKTLLNNYSKLINSDLYKNYPYDKEKEISFINIDISFPVSYNKKNKNTPFLQIEYIRNSLKKYTDADIVIRILKRALKLTDMNNSYKGGLSSYTLFLLVISFLKNSNKTNGINNNKPKKNSYGHAFHDTVKFFSKFDFYSNIIDIENKNGEIFLKRNKRYSSPEYENIPIILDPVNGQNAGKSSFRINDVQKTFIIINEELEKLRNIYDTNTDNKDNIYNNKDNFDKNLIITLLKNVEKRILMK